MYCTFCTSEFYEDDYIVLANGGLHFECVGNEIYALCPHCNVAYCLYGFTVEEEEEIEEDDDEEDEEIEDEDEEENEERSNAY